MKLLLYNEHLKQYHCNDFILYKQQDDDDKGDINDDGEEETGNDSLCSLHFRPLKFRYSVCVNVAQKIMAHPTLYTQIILLNPNQLTHSFRCSVVFWF